MKRNVEGKIAQRITNAALYTVKNTVGKSFPVSAHEVKMPESIKKQFLNAK